VDPLVILSLSLSIQGPSSPEPVWFPSLGGFAGVGPTRHTLCLSLSLSLSPFLPPVLPLSLLIPTPPPRPRRRPTGLATGASRGGGDGVVRLGGGTTEMVLLMLHCGQAGGRGRVVELSRRGGRSSRSRGRGGGRIQSGLLRPLPAGVLAITVGGLPPGVGDEAGEGERVGRQRRCEAGRSTSAGARTRPT
jgi:hypothetical protein